MKLYSVLLLVLIFTASFLFLSFQFDGDIDWNRLSVEKQPEEPFTDFLSSEEADREGNENSLVDFYIPGQEAEKDVRYEEGYETVYATTDVNIQSGPGADFPVLGAAFYSSCIIRTGFAENGWSQVLYNGNTAYIDSDYLSTDPPFSGEFGTAGRLMIPSVGIDVALYACGSSSEYADEQQKIVDNRDSAAYIEQAHTNDYVIADHNHQGFNAIKSSVPYETYAYINFGSYVQRYVCTEVGQGKNLGNNLIDWNGRSLNYDPIPGGLAMYTCNANSTDVTITYWQAA